MASLTKISVKKNDNYQAGYGSLLSTELTIISGRQSPCDVKDLEHYTAIPSSEDAAKLIWQQWIVWVCMAW